MTLLLLHTLCLTLVEFLLALLPLGLLLLLLLTALLLLLLLLQTPLLLLLLTAQFTLLLLHLLLHLLLLAALLLLLGTLLLLHPLLHLLLGLLRAMVLPAPFGAILRGTLIIVVGQSLSTHAQAQQTNACQAPDGRIHGFLTG
jgi:hypothetical protein